MVYRAREEDLAKALLHMLSRSTIVNQVLITACFPSVAEGMPAEMRQALVASVRLSLRTHKPIQRLAHRG